MEHEFRLETAQNERYIRIYDLEPDEIFLFVCVWMPFMRDSNSDIIIFFLYLKEVNSALYVHMLLAIQDPI